MSSGAHGHHDAGGKSGVGLRLTLGCEAYAIPLQQVVELVGYATLEGQPEEYFAGWLMLHGTKIPVFDLSRVVCDLPAPEHFGTRILVVRTKGSGLIGLLAAGVVDTVEPGAVETLRLDQYLPMLETMIPALGAA